MIGTFLKGLAAAALALSLAAPAAAADTVTVTDVLDRKVEVPAKAERILLGFYFEDFFAVGGPDAYDRVAAISRGAWEGWRNQQWKAYVAAVPRIDALLDVGEIEGGTFSLEAAIAAKPDVVILAAWQIGMMPDLIERFEAAGLPVVVLDYNAQLVEKHVASTLALGAILNAEERAQELVDLYAGAHADVAARLKDVTDRPVVYFELGNKGADEYSNSYGDVMWGKLVDTAGGLNIGKSQLAKWGPLSPEYVLAQQPEVIFLAGSSWMSKDKAVLMGPGLDPAITAERMRPYMARPGWDALPAIKNGELHAVYHGGARTLYDFAFLQYIAKTLHPEKFEDVDPQANLTAFFDKYMPIPFGGVYIAKLP